MKHPLENPSLTPIGFVFPLYRKRVFQKLEEWMVNGDYHSALFWQKINRLNSVKPRPAETIIHSIMPAISGRARIETGDFEFAGKRYVSRDIKVLSTFMQWFGTNVGKSFINDRPLQFKASHPLREFTEKFALENHHDRLVVSRIHDCDRNKCGPGIVLGLRECCPDSSEVTDRDRLVVDALMHWLGTKAGREYMQSYDAYIRRVCKRKRESNRTGKVA